MSMLWTEKELAGILLEVLTRFEGEPVITRLRLRLKELGHAVNDERHQFQCLQKACREDEPLAQALLDAGIPGYFCFADENGTDRQCYYDPEDTCVECALDGGLPRDCPAASCVTWRGRYGCQ